MKLIITDLITEMQKTSDHGNAAFLCNSEVKLLLSYIRGLEICLDDAEQRYVKARKICNLDCVVNVETMEEKK
jgi:hypothetical protein